MRSSVRFRVVSEGVDSKPGDTSQRGLGRCCFECPQDPLVQLVRSDFDKARVQTRLLRLGGFEDVEVQRDLVRLLLNREKKLPELIRFAS